MANEKNTVSGSGAKYRLTEKAYINDVLYEEGAEITYEGIPGYHMEPINAAAEAMKKSHPQEYFDPILQMTNVGARA